MDWRILWLCCKVRCLSSGWVLGGCGNQAMSDFKGRHFEGEIVLWRAFRRNQPVFPI